MTEQEPDIERLRAEVDHWKAHAEEAGDGFSRICLDYARVSARNVRLAEGVAALADDLERQCDAAAITYQSAEQRSRATAGTRALVRDLRALLDPATRSGQEGS